MSLLKNKLLVIGKVWPEPKSSAAGSRMLQIIEMFKSKGFEIHFASTATETDFSTNLTELEVHCHQIKLNDSSFDEFVVNVSPNIVVFDRFMTEEQFGWRVREKLPDCFQILDTEDLHFLRYARQECVKKEVKFTNDALYHEKTIRELSSIMRCDLSLIISRFEIDLLQEVFKINTSKLHYLPILFDEINGSQVKFEDRKNLVFIGNFLHEPNWDGVLQLKSHWSHIRKLLPKVNLEIYGAYPSQKVFELHNEKEGFLIKGRADNAFEVLQSARLLLAPLRFGAGLKGKLLESMLVGTPSVTTSIGAEGIAFNNKDWNGIICDDFLQLNENIIDLYHKEAMWESAQNRGYDILKKGFITADFKEAFMDKVLLLQKKLSAHRHSNYLGEILHHHTLSSTKYLSKWIEEKNKKLDV